MPLWGGERIISRRETKVIVSKAKKIEEVKQYIDELHRELKNNNDKYWEDKKMANTKKTNSTILIKNVVLYNLYMKSKIL